MRKYLKELGKLSETKFPTAFVDSFIEVEQDITKTPVTRSESEKHSILPWNQISTHNLPHTYFHKLWQIQH